MQNFHKHFFYFAVCAFAFIVYNEITLRIFEPDLFNSLLPPTPTTYWNAPLLVGNVLILGIGCMYAIVSIEEIETFLYPNKEPAWFFVYMKRFIKEKTAK